jgi:hypothetical protein
MFKKLFILSLFLLPLTTFAVETPVSDKYVPLVQDFPIKDVKDVGSGFVGFVNKIIIFVIAGTGVLALGMIVWGGIQYITTDSWSDKNFGKKKIQAALGGLLLALSTYLILNTIDPTLTNLDFTKDLSSVKVGGGGKGVMTNSVSGNVSTSTQNVYGPSEADNEGSSSTGDVNSAKGQGQFSLAEFKSQIGGIADINTCAGLSEARQLGRVTDSDKSGYVGNLSPEIAWLSVVVPKDSPDLEVMSTYRSPEHNAGVPGASKSSAHMRGEAIDFGTGTTAPTMSGNSLVEWARRDPCHIGIRQVIYQEIGYNTGGGTWGNAEHKDHVHIGR